MLCCPTALASSSGSAEEQDHLLCRTWNDRDSTIKLADSYAQDVVMQLLEVSVKNVRRSKENILREIRNLAREPQKFLGVNGEELLEDVVEDVEGSWAMGTEITKNTDVTFKDPWFYCWSGHAQVAPPAVLPPKSTISCFFAKTSSIFQGSVGLLVYHGPEVHLALLFSTPFNYALHSIEFTLAVLTGPITSDQLEHIFDSILQEKGSKEMKVVKCVLGVPGRSWSWSMTLTIRAIVSNVQMTKMNVVIETKAT